MESNIKGLVAAGHEMASELKAECGAVDMRSVAKLISYLATQLELAKAIRKGPDMPEFDGPTPVTPDGWISCSERMPDKLIPVMVMYEDGEMWSAMWNGNRWDDGTEYPDPHSVTHWREMPAEPPQEVNRG